MLLVRSLAPVWVAYLDSDWSMALASLARLTTAALVMETLELALPAPLSTRLRMDYASIAV